MGKHGLLCTLGDSPGVVTAVLEALDREQGIRPAEVVLVGTRSPGVTGALHELAHRFDVKRGPADSEEESWNGALYEGNPLSVQVILAPVADVRDVRERRIFSDAVAEQIRALRQRVKKVHVSITGGRRTMACAAMDAARREGVDAVWWLLGEEYTVSCRAELVQVTCCGPAGESKEPAARFGGMVYVSAAMRELCERARRWCRTSMPIVLEGPTGCGKTILARAIHDESPRRGAPFEIVDAAAQRQELMESDLFGHVAGAFTGAQASRPGKVRRAHGGTIFLDELDVLPPDLQPKLLRAIDENVVRPVGSDEDARVDARWIVASGRGIEELRREGRLREDLFHRLGAGRLRVPPLEDRPEDIPVLADHVLRRFCAEQEIPLPLVTPGALDVLCNYRWPGNVRQLMHTLGRIVVESDGRAITPGRIEQILQADEEENPPAIMPLSDLIRRHACLAVERSRNRSEAARRLRISERRLRRILQRSS